MIIIKINSTTLLADSINLVKIVPVSFISSFHDLTSGPHNHQLYSMLKFLLTQYIFFIQTDTLLDRFLTRSRTTRFLRFDVVLVSLKFTLFKQNFLLDLQSMFDHLVVLTESPCQKLDFSLASITPTVPKLNIIHLMNPNCGYTIMITPILHQSFQGQFVYCKAQDIERKNDTYEFTPCRHYSDHYCSCCR